MTDRDGATSQGVRYPALADLDTADDAAYEWLLSDHPWAQAERSRRRSAHHARELREVDEVLAITQRLQRDIDPSCALYRLAQTVERLARDHARRAEVDTTEDDATRTARNRRQFVAMRRNTRADYDYPAHLIGPRAAEHPPPRRAPR